MSPVQAYGRLCDLLGIAPFLPNYSDAIAEAMSRIRADPDFDPHGDLLPLVAEELDRIARAHSHEVS